MERFKIVGFDSPKQYVYIHLMTLDIFMQYSRLILLMFERYGQRFAFWTDEARSLLQGTFQPIFREPRKRAITEEIPAHM